MASRLTFFSRSRSRQTSGCGSIRLLNSGEASYDASYSRLWIKLQRVTVLAGLFRVRITFSLGAEDRLEAPSPPLPAFGRRVLRTHHIKNVTLGAKGDFRLKPFNNHYFSLATPKASCSNSIARSTPTTWIRFGNFSITGAKLRIPVTPDRRITSTA